MIRSRERSPTTGEPTLYLLEIPAHRLEVLDFIKERKVGPQDESEK